MVVSYDPLFVNVKTVAIDAKVPGFQSHLFFGCAFCVGHRVKIIISKAARTPIDANLTGLATKQIKTAEKAASLPSQIES